MTGIPRYPKVLALGHRTIKNIWDGPVEITEKIDGSQFYIGLNVLLLDRHWLKEPMYAPLDSSFIVEEANLVLGWKSGMEKSICANPDFGIGFEKGPAQGYLTLCGVFAEVSY